MTSYETTQKRFHITNENKIIHPQYSNESSLHNIALLKLPEKIIFNEVISKINMSSANTHSYSGETAYLIVWGNGDTLKAAKGLQSLPLLVKNPQACR